MSILEAMIYGPFFCFVAGAVAAALLQIIEPLGSKLWNKAAIALSLVIATGAVWAVGDMSGVGQAATFKDYPEPPPIDYGRYTR